MVKLVENIAGILNLTVARTRVSADTLKVLLQSLNVIVHITKRATQFDAFLHESFKLSGKLVRRHSIGCLKKSRTDTIFNRHLSACP